MRLRLFQRFWLFRFIKKFKTGGKNLGNEKITAFDNTEKMVLLRQQNKGQKNKIFVAASKNFTAGTKRFVDRTMRVTLMIEQYILLL